MLNKVTLIGRLTADPELRFTSSGTAVCSFTLAVDSGYGDYKRTDFFNVVVWAKSGEHCAKYLSKGKLACVDGRLQIRPYENKDNEKRYATEIVANEVIFLSPKEQGKQTQAEDDFVYSGEPSDDLPF